MAREFPQVRLLTTENRGFAAANNRGLETVDADWILFLNPDTEIVAGTLGDLISLLRQRPTVGLAAVEHLTPDGELFPTIRRFALRWLCEALGSERAPFHASWLGERELDLALYEKETGATGQRGAMLARKAALSSAGRMDGGSFSTARQTSASAFTRQAGDSAFPSAWHDRASRQQGGLERSVCSADCFRTTSVHGEAFLACPSRGGTSSARSRVCVAGGRGQPRPEVDAGRRACARAALATLVGRRSPPFGYPTRDEDLSM